MLESENLRSIVENMIHESSCNEMLLLIQLGDDREEWNFQGIIRLCSMQIFFEEGEITEADLRGKDTDEDN